jgi:hypothetical protein
MSRDLLNTCCERISYQDFVKGYTDYPNKLYNSTFTCKVCGKPFNKTTMDFLKTKYELEESIKGYPTKADPTTIDPYNTNSYMDARTRKLMGLPPENKRLFKNFVVTLKRLNNDLKQLSSIWK